MSDLTLDEYRGLSGGELERILRRESEVFLKAREEAEKGLSMAVPSGERVSLQDILQACRLILPAFLSSDGLKECNAP